MIVQKALGAEGEHKVRYRNTLQIRILKLMIKMLLATLFCLSPCHACFIIMSPSLTPSHIAR